MSAREKNLIAPPRPLRFTGCEFTGRELLPLNKLLAIVTATGVVICGFEQVSCTAKAPPPSLPDKVVAGSVGVAMLLRYCELVSVNVCPGNRKTKPTPPSAR